MRSLPVELLHQIVHSDLSKRDLRQLRAVNRAFQQLVVRDVFRKLYVTPTIKSGQGLHNILNTPALAVHVQEIEFEENVEESESARKKRKGAKKSNELLRATLADAYSLLHQVPHLHTLIFAFCRQYREEHAWEDSHVPSHELRLQWAILGAVPSTLPALRSLELHCPMPFTNGFGVDKVQHVPAIGGTLHHLHICMLAEGRYEDAHVCPEQEDFWAQVDLNLLRPATELRSLYVDAFLWLGIAPNPNFHLLTYPHLESLTLRRVLFDGRLEVIGTEDCIGTEDFIARHGKTLRILQLFHCAIVHEDTPLPDMFWSKTWRRFGRELAVLSHLYVTFEQDDDTDGESPVPTEALFKYGLFSRPSFVPDVGGVPGEEEDEAALAALLAVVASRREASPSDAAQ
ncbi:hypothetical protein FA95DRAFT_949515 [Auriscalpium vulgare]|uniref:Uncharacterized protein n=1 Tax=Auriscalpium vulgare TaxID=40419 RepID=A0ACB8RY32_9AGAM|nr:hypothetical protein FA95DRAFT_949515 [Auriscalpium vulgare]